MSLKIQIFNYLKAREDQWINGNRFEELALRIGKKGSNASRRLRELANESGYIQRRISGKSVEYRFFNPAKAKVAEPKEELQTLFK